MAGIDYSGAYARAKNLLSISSDSKIISNAVKSKAAGMSKWSGKTADACLAALNNWCKTSLTLEKEMESLAALINSTAGVMEAEEIAAAKAAAAKAAAAKAAEAKAAEAKAAAETASAAAAAKEIAAAAAKGGAMAAVAAVASSALKGGK